MFYITHFWTNSVGVETVKFSCSSVGETSVLMWQKNRIF